MTGEVLSCSPGRTCGFFPSTTLGGTHEPRTTQRSRKTVGVAAGPTRVADPLNSAALPQCLSTNSLVCGFAANCQAHVPEGTSVAPQFRLGGVRRGDRPTLGGTRVSGGALAIASRWSLPRFPS